ncbi:MAG: phosphoribosylanthranilate isomerase [Methanofollis sp.]|nr:phosphoribosylanthranilate isomerase [Methanofollis sp.]
MRLKICGITRVADALAAEAAGADAVGVVMFSDSPRSVAPAEAAAIFSALGPFIGRVCVSTTDDPADLAGMLALGPTAVQLYHDLDVPAGVRTIRGIGDGRVPAGRFDALLLDASMGAGTQYDLREAQALVRTSPVPVILSGGLNPENIGTALAAVEPYAADVSSGVEDSPGIKNVDKMKACIMTCRGLTR